VGLAFMVTAERGIQFDILISISGFHVRKVLPLVSIPIFCLGYLQ